MSEFTEKFKHLCVNGNMNKPAAYSTMYESLLSQYRNTDVNLVELGIRTGGSLKLWKEYLGENAKIFGLDKNKSTLFTYDQIQCFAIDQSNKESLKTIPSLIPRIDVFIDDGSHLSSHQILTFEVVFPFISNGGLYIIEDVVTSYWKDKYDGEYKKPTTCIEYSKNIIDSFCADEDKRIVPHIHIDKIESVSFYKWVICFKKK